MQRGDKSELEFEAILKHKGVKFRRATEEEQRLKHEDYITEAGSVDVKAAKKLVGSDPKVQYERVLLELHGKRYKGWLAGCATMIAFDLESGFLLVDRKELLKWAELMVGEQTPISNCINPLEDNPRPKDYVAYSRGDEEKYFWCPVEDICAEIGQQHWQLWEKVT